MGALSASLISFGVVLAEQALHKDLHDNRRAPIRGNHILSNIGSLLTSLKCSTVAIKRRL